jgi:hypothetical protein
LTPRFRQLQLSKIFPSDQWYITFAFVTQAQ